METAYWLAANLRPLPIGHGPGPRPMGGELVVCCSIITVLPNLPPLCSLKLETLEIKALGQAPLLSLQACSPRQSWLSSLFSDSVVSWDMILLRELLWLYLTNIDIIEVCGKRNRE